MAVISRTDDSLFSSRSVQRKNLRFQILTDRVVRVEYSPSCSFLDAPTISFADRSAALQQPLLHTLAVNDVIGGGVEITNTFFNVVFNPAGQTSDVVTRDTLCAKVFKTGRVWRPGDVQSDNLLGTCKSLDAQDGPADISPLAKEPLKHASFGVCSQAGWALIDDTLSGVFVPSKTGRWPMWCEERVHEEAYFDWYLFLHGLDFKAAVTDLYILTGRAPIVPRWCLGVWHSQVLV